MTGCGLYFSKRLKTNLNWCVAIIVVIFLSVATGSAILLHRAANQHRQTENLLTTLEMQANKLSSLEWRAVAERKLDRELADEFNQVSVDVKDTVHLLLDSKSAGVNVVLYKYNQYFEYTKKELDLIKANRFDQARAIDNQFVDPIYKDLIKQIKATALNYKKEASTASWLGYAGVSIIFVVTSLVITLLFWQLDRQRLINRNIEMEQKLEKELSRLDRLNLVGEMAAALGHEVRNPMTSVRGFLQLMAERNGNGADREYFELMIQELDRANSIITEYLSLAKNKRVDLQRRNLNQIITQLIPLLQADAILCDREVRADLGNTPELFCDEKEIRQLIINLVRNGLEATPPGGVVVISTFVRNEKVILEIRDQGSGLPPEIIDKIGTPFITTKEGGTGLGLAVSYSIANRHHARMDYKTGPGGTAFYVNFTQIQSLGSAS